MGISFPNGMGPIVNSYLPTAAQGAASTGVSPASGAASPQQGSQDVFVPSPAGEKAGFREPYGPSQASGNEAAGKEPGAFNPKECKT